VACKLRKRLRRLIQKDKWASAILIRHASQRPRYNLPEAMRREGVTRETAKVEGGRVLLQTALRPKARQEVGREEYTQDADHCQDE